MERQLNIGLDGDDQGLERAFQSAENAARAYDRELSRVERQQVAAEYATRRIGNAIQRYSRDQDRAAESARRAGTAAREAAQSAERAIRDAADATEELARGEISQEQAAQRAAAAEREIERAAMAAAAAHRAAAHAAEEQAEEERRLARDAEMAGHRQRLAQLRAAGATEEHDRLLHQLRSRFPGLGDDGDAAFSRMGKSATAAGAAMTSPTGGIAKVAAGLAALPWVASAAATAITLGLGGALIGLGLKASAGSKSVKKEIDGLKKHIKTESKDIGKPFEQTWHVIADAARDTFDELIPDLRSALADLAPYASAFADDFIRSFKLIGPALDDVVDAAGPMFNALGNEMPGLMGRIADAISRIAAAADPEMFARMVDSLGLLITGAGHAIAVLTKLTGVFLKFGPIAIAARNIDKVGSSLRKVAGDGVSAKDAIALVEAQMVSYDLGASAAASATTLMASGMSSASGNVGSLGATMKLASQTAKDLRAELDKLAGKTLTLREASSAYQAAVDAAATSIKQNGREIGFNTEKSRANEAALNALVTAAHNQSVAMRDSGKSAQEVARHMNTARARFVSTAQQMGYTRKQAEALATKLFGVKRAADQIPKKKHTNVTASTGQARSAINQLIAEMSARTINIGVNLLGGAFGAAHGGYVGYATGGPVKGYPTGGPVRGPGTATSDSIPALLSNGEYVINAAATSQYRPLLEAINSGRTGGSSTPSLGLPQGAAGGGGPIVVILEMDKREFGKAVIELGRGYSDNNHGRNAFATVKSR
ncbi:hypothetical protein [Actinomadura sp. HBU206391]|uniref:hypothetical protein n=1 Tax=Actinomadura sp. HBU206391 TaxID=2731692 RepID=UPI00164FC134|nr:hypothetical protein [Actinomadura sp. HBU206391]MBC6458428.1 hypothetical protein [Actinomadura sp. HBU206391]